MIGAVCARMSWLAGMATVWPQIELARRNHVKHRRRYKRKTTHENKCVC